MPRQTFTAIAAVLCLLASPVTRGQSAPAGEDVAALRGKVEQLERENQTLRMQWGQATMELDRLRNENEQLKRRLGVRASAEPRVGVDEPASSSIPVGGEADLVADVARRAEVAHDSELRDELQRLRQENEDLRGERNELTELAGLTADGEIVAAQDARFSREYDEGSGKTVVRTPPQQVRMLSGSAADHYLSVAYAYAGRNASAGPVEVTGFLQSRHSGGLYSGATSVEFVLDGESVTIPITQHRLTHKQAGMAGRRRVNLHDETVGFQLNPEALRRLARAVRAEGRIGKVRFALSRDDLAMFKAVHRRVELGR